MRLGTLGAFAPGNWGYGALLLGIVAILIVYRHWSWDEDDVASEMPEEEKRVAISGNLRNEVLTAVGFLFFYFPVAFARLQADGIAFSYLPGSGMVALTTFTLLEFLKAVPFLDYYEIFGSDLQFEKIANVAAPSLTAKFLTFALRASFDLVLVASLLRLPQIARLAQEGRDLRPIDEALASGDEQRQFEAVAAAHKFALRRRTRARERLIQVTQQKLSSELFRYPLDVRIAAAEALTHVGQRSRDDAALFASAAAYRQVFKERTREDGPVAWARRQNDFGAVLVAIARDRPDTAHLQEAIAAFNAALDFYRSTHLTDLWAGVQDNLGGALSAIAYRTRDGADVEAPSPPIARRSRNARARAHRSSGRRRNSTSAPCCARPAWRRATRAKSRRASPARAQRSKNVRARATRRLGLRHTTGWETRSTIFGF